MGNGIPEGSVGRVLHELTIGTIQAVRAKDANDDQNKLREIDQQFQVAISGTAGAVPAFTPATVKFDCPLYYAPGQRNSTLEFPHFTYGSQTTPAVGVHATISEWMHDEKNGSIVGAVVQIGAVGGGEPFTGFVHLTFQGFGALIEEDHLSLVEAG